MRILLDTNVIISGLLSSKGPPGRLLDAWFDEHFELATSEAQVDELARALRYEHIACRITGTLASAFVDNIDARAVVAEHLPDVQLSPDPDDNMILASAVAAGVDLIVSGDKPGVLALGEVEGIPIVSAREALARLGIADGEN